MVASFLDYLNLKMLDHSSPGFPKYSHPKDPQGHKSLVSVSLFIVSNWYWSVALIETVFRNPMQSLLERTQNTQVYMRISSCLPSLSHLVAGSYDIDLVIFMKSHSLNSETVPLPLLLLCK